MQSFSLSAMHVAKNVNLRLPALAQTLHTCSMIHNGSTAMRAPLHKWWPDLEGGQQEAALAPGRRRLQARQPRRHALAAPLHAGPLRPHRRQRRPFSR